MSKLVTRRAADELSRALEAGDASGMPSGTASLVALGERLRAAGEGLEAVVVPQEQFRAALRTRLVAVATVSPPAAAPAPSRHPWARAAGAQRSAGIAAGALASVVAVSGVAVASSEALPGDAFYGLKRTAEGLQLRVAGDDVDRGQRHLQFAEARLDEVRALALGRNGDPSAPGTSAAADTDWQGVRDTLADMDDQTRQGSALLERAWREQDDHDALALLSAFAARQSAALLALMPAMAPVRGEAEHSLGIVTQLAATTAERARTGGCTDTCEPGTGSGSVGGCDCADEPSSSPSPSTGTRPSAPAPTGPVPDPTGSAPATVAPPAGPTPGGPAPSEPAEPPRRLPSAPPSSLPTQLPPPPTPLPSLVPSGSPSLGSPTAPSADPVPGDVLPGLPLPGDLLPG